MDAFKGTEMARMEMGGNDAWRAFWEETEKGKTWESVGIQERYGGAVGEEWKERLSCKVEGREFVAMPAREEPSKKYAEGAGNRVGAGHRAGTPAGGTDSRKEQNEAYFARMGNENAHRPSDLPPSQGGKYGGFGSDFSAGADTEGAGRGTRDEGIPGVDEFQKDPVAALTRSFGWFTTTVGKGAKTVNEGWIQPTAQKVYLV
jgi:ADP-ribosylation factor GTPase-activating protein 1